MPDDIVKRLRGDLTGCNPQLIGADAADEIEKLRAELDAIKSPPDYGTQKIMNEQIHNAGLAMRAMDLFRKQADEFEKLRAEIDSLESVIEDNAKLVLHIRMENEALRAALKKWEDTGLQKDWPITYDEKTQACWLAPADAAKAALGESDE